MKYIKSHGHDVGMHIHPELAPESSSEEAIFTESVNFYFECFGTNPQFFRSGGLKYNKKTIELCNECGINVLSNYFISPHYDFHNYIRIPKSFTWSNNTTEFPVHFCLDEAIRRYNNSEDAINIVKETIRDDLTHYFIHSWSFLTRDSNGHHDRVDKDYITTFEKIIKKITEIGDFVSIHTALGCNRKQVVVPIDWIPRDKHLRHHIDFSELALGYPKLSTEDFSVGFCDIRISILQIATDELHRNVSPLLLPMNLQEHQLPYVVHLEKNGLSKNFYYILSRGTAYLQMNREEFPFAEHLNDIILYMKKCDNRIENIKFSRVIGMNDVMFLPHEINHRGETYLIDFLEGFSVESSLSKQLKKEIDYCRRRLCRDYSSVAFLFFSSVDKSLCEEHIVLATTMIESRLERKDSAAGAAYKKVYTDEWFQRNMQMYLENGFVAFMCLDGVKVASYLGLYKNHEYYSIGAAFTDGKHAKFSVSKILFFELIKKLYSVGCKKMHLGGGDFGYKAKFGAQVASFCSGEIFINRSMKLEDLLLKRVPYREINNYFGTNLTEVIFKNDHIIPLEDSNFSYSPKVQGWNGYRPAVISAVQNLLQKIEIKIRDISFFNMNTGFGFNDFALCSFPFKEHGGLFVEKCVYGSFLRNCEKLNVDNFSALLSEDLSFDPEKISHYNVFYAYNPCTESLFGVLCKKILQSIDMNPREVFFIYLNNKFDEYLQEIGFVKQYEFSPRTFIWRFTSPGAVYRWSRLTETPTNC